jgi:hypothetical protein
VRKPAFLLAVALAGCAGVPPERDGSALQGRWVNVATRIHFADGRIDTQPDLRCTSEVTETLAISDCALPDGRKSRVIARILALTPTSYELEIVENNSNPDSVGARTRVEYRIVGRRLFRTVYPPQGPEPSRAIRLETIYDRE